jgi:hypothetical protein
MVLAPASPDVLHKLIAAAFVGESPSDNRQAPRSALTPPARDNAYSPYSKFRRVDLSLPPFR